MNSTELPKDSLSAKKKKKKKKRNCFSEFLNRFITFLYKYLGKKVQPLGGRVLDEIMMA